jgi:uncharacterized damage-inducible protein DinB
MTKQGLQRLIAYTDWANDRMLTAVAALSVEDFRRDLRSSHGGVRGTLVHMLWAEMIWLERFKGVTQTRKLDEGEIPDAPALRERWDALVAHRKSWLEPLKPEKVLETVSYRNTKGEEFRQPLWQLAQHMANHATHHRGQVVTMLRQLGAAAVNTDMVTWDRGR